MPGPQEKTLFFSGYAKLPAGITASAIFNVVAVGLEVEADSGNIIAADCTLATSVGRNFFQRLVIGRSIEHDLSRMIQDIECRYQGNAQKAIITALKIIHEKYNSYKVKP